MDIGVWIPLLAICLVFMALGMWAIRALFPGAEARDETRSAPELPDQDRQGERAVRLSGAAAGSRRPGTVRR